MRAGSPREVSALFKVWAAAEPQTLPRLLNYFAQRDLLASRVEASVSDGETHVVIEVEGLPAPAAEMIAEKMRQSVLVARVEIDLGASAHLLRNRTHAA